MRKNRPTQSRGNDRVTHTHESTELITTLWLVAARLEWWLQSGLSFSTNTRSGSMMNRKRYSAALRNHPSWSWRSARKPRIDRMARNRWARLRPWANPCHRSRAGAIASLNRRAKAGARAMSGFSFGRR
jgi:hypothetical protein